MGSTTSKYPKKINKANTKHFISWFEIPALNLRRAADFYNAIYGIEMETIELNGYSMAFFPTDNGIGGAVVTGNGCVPGETGTLVYLNGGSDLSAVLGKVEAAGGRVVMDKTFINDQAGYFAIFIDTEGNKLALHSRK